MAIAVVNVMRQQEKTEKQASEPEKRVTKPRDEERQASFGTETEDDNPYICRGID